MSDEKDSIKNEAIWLIEALLIDHALSPDEIYNMAFEHDVNMSGDTE